MLASRNADAETSGDQEMLARAILRALAAGEDACFISGVQPDGPLRLARVDGHFDMRKVAAALARDPAVREALANPAET